MSEDQVDHMLNQMCELHEPWDVFNVDDDEPADEDASDPNARKKAGP